MKKVLLLMVTSFLIVWSMELCAQTENYRIDLSGNWRFRADPGDQGIREQWFLKEFTEQIKLPGSMTTNHKGEDVSVHTDWTGSIIDSSWFFLPDYARYRKQGDVRIPFWLQPVKVYKGAAWYQKTVTIPPSWEKKRIEFFVERSHWENRVWIDDKYVDMKNSLGTPDVFDLTEYLSPGKHNITVRMDNRVNNIDVGQNSHSISDHTQGNWNGMIGKIFLAAQSQTYIDDIRLYPDIRNKQVLAHIRIRSDVPRKISLQMAAKSDQGQAEKLQAVTKSFDLQTRDSVFTVVYQMGARPFLWDEFQPVTYTFNTVLQSSAGKHEKQIQFGMREFASEGTQFTINGRKTFLRGTLECAIFPETGYPPTDPASWIRIFQKAKSYGLNHMRFHSWCPPEAAFIAADKTGFFLQIECGSWANQGAVIGDGTALDQYIYEESERIVKAYGNHPSFCMLAYGNEPDGKKYKTYLSNFVQYWKQKDSRRLYTSAAGWPVIPENDFNSSPDPRIQGWGQGLTSIINGKPPRTDYDWSTILSKWKQPTVSHEIGQWCVYPDFKEIKRYTGVLKAKNFEIFQDKLKENGMSALADSFLLASGKLQALCYKSDIEAALRTKGMAGFQLLDLHDFPGQGTALVGVLSPFWEDKGYITGKQYSEFCNAVVPLARFPKLIYLNEEELRVPVEVAQFGQSELRNVTAVWSIRDAKGKEIFNGRFGATDMPVGNGFALGEIRQQLTSVKTAAKLTLTVSVGRYQNTWDFFVYPSSVVTESKNVLIKQQLDEEAVETLNKGGKVLLTFKKGTIRKENGGNIAVGFSSIFWNTAWTNKQAPHTLGLLCNPAHPALRYFPTEYHSNWQWWDAMSHSDAVILDSVSSGLKPIVRVIDDWVTARPLGLLFECKAGNGKLLVSSIDLLTDQQKRPEARQLAYSLLTYMESDQFNPKQVVNISKLKGL